MKTLAEIQQALKAPKSQRNTFGNYNYRSCEDILTAVKPLLDEWSLTISDEIVLIGDRYYVKAIATITSPQKFHEVSAFARECQSKKGMDDAQLTGSVSSYARKYALNGLFAIDDTKDADATNDHGKTSSSKPRNQSEHSVNSTDTIKCIQKELGRLTDAFKDESSLLDIYKTLGIQNFSEIKELTSDAKETILQRLVLMK